MRKFFEHDASFKKIEKSIVFVNEEDRYDEDFIEPTQYYIVTADGTGMYFRTRDRVKAQKWSDMLFGKGFYQVRKAIKAVTR